MADEDPTETAPYREVEYEERLSRGAVIDHLEAFTEAFRDDETVTLTIGEERVAFEPPEHLEFELEYEEGGDEREIEFELEWRVDGDDLSVDGESDEATDEREE